MKQLLPALAALACSGLPIPAAVVLTDTFDYPDGPLVTASESRWTTHSGTAGQTDVVSRQVQLTQGESEDVNAALDGQPYLPAGGATLYVKLTVNFSELPKGAGGYFAHFNAASNQRGRLFATTNGAAAGFFRVGVSAAAASASAVLDTDLALNTPHLLVCRYSVADALSTLWLAPTAESDPGVTSTDAASPAAISAFAFRQSLSSGHGMGALAIDDLIIGTAFADVVPITTGPPVILRPLADQTVTEGQSVTFTVSARGEAPLSYLWQHEGTHLVDETASSLTLTAVTTNQAGTYTVLVGNPLGSATNNATLTVLPRPVAVATNLAYLRTLVSNPDFLPSDTTTLFAVEGVVTTHTNLSPSAHALFFLQDDSAGIAVSVNGGSEVRPAAGDRLRVTGPLGHSDGLLQLALEATHPDHHLEILGHENPLPPARPLEFAWQGNPTFIDSLEGSRVVASNVFLDLSGGAHFTAGSNVTVTNAAGETFTLRIDSRVTELIGQPKPTTPVTLFGVLSQSDPSAPHTSGYQLLPTSAADLIAPRLPTIRFTNTLENLVRPGDAPSSSTFTEYALRPGERLRLQAQATDDLGRDVVLQPMTNELPAGTEWTFDRPPSAAPTATLTFTPTVTAAGHGFRFVLGAANEEGTGQATWVVYVPTAVEQRVVISEFLANPTADPAAPHYNPLHRETPGPASVIATEDEYVEIVNLAAETVDLSGWTLADGVTVRHTFAAGESLSASNAAVVYGGRALGSEPRLAAGVQALPASGGSAGLSLNNSGDSIIVRNGSGQIVERVTYGSVSGYVGSVARYPNLAGGFVEHSRVAANPGSPGTQNDGRLFSEPAPADPGSLRLSVERAGSGLRIGWRADPGRDYVVEHADAVNGTFSELATGLRFSTSQGEFTMPELLPSTTRFFRVRTL